MHFFSSLLAISAATSSVLAHRPHSIAGNAHAHLHHQRQAAAGSVFVTGANGMGDNQIHSRLEINDMAINQPEQFSLLILAMSEWQSESMDNITGYYQVAGIHGVPHASYDGVEKCDTCGDPDGYCTHVSILFPAWHRAYLALFEQELLNTVNRVANAWTGSNRNAILAAAATMRLPFWDWAARPDPNSNVLPSIMSSPQITINGSNGQQTVNNPLYTYAIPDDSIMVYSPFTTWQNTLRYPNSDVLTATSVETSAINALNNIQPNMQDSVYQLLTNCKDYDHFSHDGATGSTSCSNSLEGIHNTIHTTVGGPGVNGISGGHMTYLPLAAFDPIFWFHHANIDRLFALWQTVNPDSYGGSQVAVANTWTIAQGSTQDENSPLTPFRKDAQSFWTTNLVKDWANTFKYTYPEFESTDGSQSAIIDLINSLYGTSPTLTASSVSERVKSESDSQSSPSSSAQPKRPVQPTKGSSHHYGSNGTSTAMYPTGSGSPHYSSASASASSTRAYPTPSSTGNNGQNEYSCNVRTPRFAYNVSYTVYVFDGEPSTQDNTQWLADENCVGSLGILAGGAMMKQNITAAGSVPLTRHLQAMVKKGSLASMNEEHVTPYLKQNLNWKIVKQGAEIHPSELPSYKAAVYSGTSSPQGPNGLPQWSAWQPQIEATKDKAGGIQSTEEADNEWPVNYPGGSSSATTVVIATQTAVACPAPSNPGASYSAPTPSTASVPYSAPTPYAPAPYPTGSAPSPYSPVGGTAAPTGAYGTTYVPSSSPSSSPITPYTGAGTRNSGNFAVGIALSVLASALLF